LSWLVRILAKGLSIHSAESDHEDNRSDDS